MLGEENRHIFIKSIGNVHYYHYDPYSQAFSKIVRGFERDLRDVKHMEESGLIALSNLKQMVDEIPESEFRKYPNLSKATVVKVVETFLQHAKQKK